LARALSTDDLDLLFHGKVHSITAVASGGSIWRARQCVPAALIAEFALRFARFRLEIEQCGYRAEIYFHARLLWLEKRGAIFYSWHMSEKVRQMMDPHADLLRRLVDADP